MTAKEIKSIINNTEYNFTDNFRELIIFKNEFTRVKYIIKSMSERIGDTDDMSEIIKQMSKVKLGAVVNRVISLTLRRSACTDEPVDKHNTPTLIHHTNFDKEQQKINKWVTNIVSNTNRMLQLSALIYAKNGSADSYINKLKEVLSNLVDDTSKVTILDKTQAYEGLITFYTPVTVDETADEITENVPEMTADAVLSSEDATTLPETDNAVVGVSDTKNDVPGMTDDIVRSIMSDETEYKEAV